MPLSWDIAVALDELVQELLSAADIQRPPIDALRVAASVGLTVAWDNRQVGRARYLRLRGTERDHCGTILVKPDPREERRQWSVAHELGEASSQQIFDKLGIDAREAPPAEREALANQFANRLLLPTRFFARDGARVEWDLPALKEMYATASHELIARRMLDFEPPVVITIFDHDRLTFRRCNWQGPAPPLASVERAARSEAHTAGVVVFRGEALLNVRAWPVHEEGWKREIVRTTLVDPEHDCTVAREAL